ncbi:hypothetical protein, partial [Clavibacter michiganensis]|uniref:hypothetical protein n=1 Tax=Clavibacter michiganensis TaxID=28447 RepID=UPI00292F7677
SPSWAKAGTPRRPPFRHHGETQVFPTPLRLVPGSGTGIFVTFQGNVRDPGDHLLLPPTSLPCLA